MCVRRPETGTRAPGHSPDGSLNVLGAWLDWWRPVNLRELPQAAFYVEELSPKLCHLFENGVFLKSQSPPPEPQVLCKKMTLGEAEVQGVFCSP